MRTSSLLAPFALAVVMPAQQPGPVFDPASLIPGTNLHRCSTPGHSVAATAGIDNPDCDYNQTNPSAAYAPTNLLRIPVVVHVIQNTAGQGFLSDALVQSQIVVLNEDFKALAGTPGAAGTDTRIEFFLATSDPLGAATNGITRHTNDTWFADSGSYWNSIAWNPQRYLNLYTNNAGGGGTLGYVPDLPQGPSGVAGTSADRVVILWSAFGRPALGGAPYNTGRTATHEVGHYLGLFHTFQGSCGTAACYSSGDLICDTNAESSPHFGCPAGSASCGPADPIHNYLDYTDDTCMTGFTAEQARRMRCTLGSYRPLLAQLAGPIATATTRTGAGNQNTRYTTSVWRLGQSATAAVITAGSGLSVATIFGYSAAATVPYAGMTILIDLASPCVFQLPILVNPSVAVWTISVPSTPTLAGLQIKSQGVLVGSSLVLTNAFDLVLGN